MSPSLHIGLLGAGRIGSFHARTLAALSTVDTLTIYDPDAGRARAVAAETGGRLAGTPEELFTSQPDGVVVAAATATHADLVRAALAAGVPVFCEKPLATSLAETGELVRAAEHAGVPVMVGFQRRSDPAYRELRERIRGGEAGDLYLVRMVVGDDAPPPAGYVAGSGGLFRDQSVHDFDVLRWLTGQEVTQVYATGSNLTGGAEFAAAGDVDTGAVVLRLSGGTVAVLTASRHSASGYDVRLEVAGSKAVLSVGGAPAPGGFLTRFGAAYRAEMESFVALAAGAGDNPCPPGEALAALAVADAAAASRLADRPVPVEPARAR